MIKSFTKSELYTAVAPMSLLPKSLLSTTSALAVVIGPSTTLPTYTSTTAIIPNGGSYLKFLPLASYLVIGGTAPIAYSCKIIGYSRTNSNVFVPTTLGAFQVTAATVPAAIADSYTGPLFSTIQLTTTASSTAAVVLNLATAATLSVGQQLHGNSNLNATNKTFITAISGTTITLSETAATAATANTNVYNIATAAGPASLSKSNGDMKIYESSYHPSWIVVDTLGSELLAFNWYNATATYGYNGFYGFI